MASGASSSGDVFSERLLLCWINTLPLQSCLLVSSLLELQDGGVLADMVHHLYAVSCPPQLAEHPTDRVEWLLDTLREKLGPLPSTLSSKFTSLDVVKVCRPLLCCIPWTPESTAQSSPPSGMSLRVGGHLRSFHFPCLCHHAHTHSLSFLCHHTRTHSLFLHRVTICG
mgnify:CR=1 FL=1